LLLVSTVFIGVGLLSGVLVNLINQRMGEAVLPWNDPVIVSSAILFAWLLVSMLFNLCYRPARQGRKVAYLVMASFLFLVVEFTIVLYVGHATGQGQAPGQSTPDHQDVSLENASSKLASRGGGL